jgi:hypothetical protein
MAVIDSALRRLWRLLVSGQIEASPRPKATANKA